MVLASSDGPKYLLNEDGNQTFEFCELIVLVVVNEKTRMPPHTTHAPFPRPMTVDGDTSEGVDDG